MKFSGWTINNLIDWLQGATYSKDFPYSKDLKCYGEIKVYIEQGDIDEIFENNNSKKDDSENEKG